MHAGARALNLKRLKLLITPFLPIRGAEKSARKPPIGSLNLLHKPMQGVITHQQSQAGTNDTKALLKIRHQTPLKSLAMFPQSRCTGRL